MESFASTAAAAATTTITTTITTTLAAAAPPACTPAEPSLVVAVDLGPALASAVAPLVTAVEALATPGHVAWARALVPSGISVLGTALVGLLGWSAGVAWARREKKKKEKEEEEEGAAAPVAPVAPASGFASAHRGLVTHRPGQSSSEM